MQLHEAISAANAQDRLGLIVYAIPNFPTPAVYRAVLHLLVEEQVVSVIETTLPVTGGFSEHANGDIVQAHRLAASYGQAWQALIEELPAGKSLLCVLYRESAEQIGWARLLRSFSGRMAGILPEWHAEQVAPYACSAGSHQVEFVTCVGPWMTEDDIAGHLAYALDQPLVYLMSAAMTGAALYPAAALERTIVTIRQCRPEAKVAAGFGVRTAEDIRRLGTVHGLNAVIVGTAFLQQMRAGPHAVGHYLRSLKGALTYA